MIIEVDAFKKLIVGYDPKNSEKFHTKSAKLADKAFYAELKSGKYSEVVFLAGGAASGKTEFASIFLQQDNILVYDGTLQNTLGFEIKLKEIIKYMSVSSVRVVLIVPEDISVAYKVFLGRERKMNDSTFVRTQINSKLSVINIVRNHPDVEVQIYSNFINEKENSLSLFQRIETDDVISLLETVVKGLEDTLPNIIINAKIDDKE